MAMYPNLEVEQTRCGHSDEYVAGRLGITERAYRRRKESNAIPLSEAAVLVDMYDKSMEYLFRDRGDGNPI
jgi:hypothetical protein